MKKYSQSVGAPAPVVPQSWGGSGETLRSPPGLGHDPEGSGGKQTALPTTDETARSRNPAEATPLTKVKSPESGSSGASAEFMVVDSREFGVQIDEDTKAKATIREDKIDKKVQRHLEAVERQIRPMIERNSKVEVWVREVPEAERDETSTLDAIGTKREKGHKAP